MIKINVKEAVKINADYSAFISFPYNAQIVNLVRDCNSRFWDNDVKVWEVSLNDLPDFIYKARKFGIELEGQMQGEPEEVKIDLPEEFEFKTKPFSYQLEAIQYGLQKNSFLLGDEQGLGKTKDVIDLAIIKKHLYGYKHCLIVCCVNGLKWNWYEEIKIHSNEAGWILGSRLNSKRKLRVLGNQEKYDDLCNLPDNYFLITNVETLRDEEITDKLKELIESGEISMIAVDEIHKCKNPSSQQGKGLLKLQKAECKIAMTGTPVTKWPLDTFTIFKWLGYEKHSFYQFKKHYCVMGGYGGHEVVSYKNLSEMQDRLDSIMIRRLKKDVTDLPPKIYMTEFVEMTAKQQIIYNEIHAEMRSNIDQVKISNNPLAQLIRLRQATGYTGILSGSVKESAKLARMEELIDEATADGKKVIVYSQWTQITDEICRRLEMSAIKYVSITGQNTGEENHENEYLFQHDPSYKVCVGTIGALGTGFTLTAATVEIFVDEPWDKKTKEQAEDRAHRIGTSESPTIITLVTKDSIDERIQNIVYKKGVMSDFIVDGGAGVKLDASVIEYLLS